MRFTRFPVGDDEHREGCDAVCLVYRDCVYIVICGVADIGFAGADHAVPCRSVRRLRRARCGGSGVLGLCVDPLFMVWLISVPPLRRVTLSWQSNQTVSLPCPALLRRVPSLRHCSAGTRRTGIHALAALARHPCRAPGYATPALGLPKSQFVVFIKSRYGRRKSQKPKSPLRF